MSATSNELMVRARSGQGDALGELCALYRNYLRALARAGLGPRLRERVELSDVVQEVMVEVVRQFPQFTGDSEVALVGWLRRLVGNKLADLGRYHSRLKRGAGGASLPLEAAWEGYGGDARAGAKGDPLLTRAMCESGSSPSEVASRRELTGLLSDALDALPEDEARVLWLYHAENLSFEEIGRRLGVSRKVVRGVWACGLKALRRAVAGPPGGALRLSGPVARALAARN